MTLFPAHKNVIASPHRTLQVLRISYLDLNLREPLRFRRSIAASARQGERSQALPSC